MQASAGERDMEGTHSSVALALLGFNQSLDSCVGLSVRHKNSCCRHFSILLSPTTRDSALSENFAFMSWAKRNCKSANMFCFLQVESAKQKYVNLYHAPSATLALTETQMRLMS